MLEGRRQCTLLSGETHHNLLICSILTFVTAFRASQLISITSLSASLNRDKIQWSNVGVYCKRSALVDVQYEHSKFTAACRKKEETYSNELVGTGSFPWSNALE
jgi:hypothetical protein